MRDKDLQVIDSFRRSYFFLSNMYETTINYGGITYPTVEHAFQAAKFEDKDIKIAMSKTRSAAEIKRRGKTTKNIRSDWEDVKYDIMLDLLRIKFTEYELAHKLKNTHPYILVEGNTWHDNTWGNCICDKCVSLPYKNMLGVLLMKVRDEIISGTLHIKGLNEVFIKFDHTKIPEVMGSKKSLRIEIINKTKNDRFEASLVKMHGRILLETSMHTIPDRFDDVVYRVLDPIIAPYDEDGLD